MQLRATFQSMKTDDPDLFVVKIAGHLGTRERKAVEDLVRRCRELGKTKVVFEFSGIESLGGSVAKVLGEFARDMAAEAHPPWFVGASSVVQSFLMAQFGDVRPCFAYDLDMARASLDRPVSKPISVLKPTATATEATPAPADDSVDEVSEVVETLRADELLAEDDEPDADAPVPAVLTAVEGVARRHSYLTLADAQPLLQELGDLRAARPILEGLLHGADLADSIHLFVLDGDRLVEDVTGTTATARWLSAGGEMIAMLQRRAGPVDVVDLVEIELAEHESEIVAELNCPIVVPVFVDEQLEGVFFVRKEQAGEEYVSSEELALDLLARQIGQDLAVGRRRARGEVGPEEKKLRAQLRRQRTVLRLGQELHAIADEERVVSRLLISLIGEMGVASAIFFDVCEDRLRARHCYGLDEQVLGELRLSDGAMVRAIEEPIRTEHADPTAWGEALERLRRLGVDLLVPMRTPHENFGLVALCVRRAEGGGSFDPDYVQTLVTQAAHAADHARGIRRLEDQTLRVAKTLIALVEKRTGTGGPTSSDQVTWYVDHVADRMSFDREHRLDLLYGAVLRDIGMIEISDLVLKSPRRLSPEEWKLVQRHPIAGAEILRSLDFSDVTCDVVLHHHERFNGEGYPHRLRGTAIPLGARIVSVVESYVAMIRDTPYRPALSSDEALAVLDENWEMRYDPSVIEVFVRVVREQPAPAISDGRHGLLVGATRAV